MLPFESYLLPGMSDFSNILLWWMTRELYLLPVGAWSLCSDSPKVWLLAPNTNISTSYVLQWVFVILMQKIHQRCLNHWSSNVTLEKVICGVRNSVKGASINFYGFINPNKQWTISRSSDRSSTSRSARHSMCSPLHVLQCNNSCRLRTQG